MTMRCTICSHPNKTDINRRILGGANVTQLARELNCAYSSVDNHKRKHLSYQLATVEKEKNLLEGSHLLEKIDGIITNAETIFQRNFLARKDHVALKALSSQRSTIDLLARISFNLKEIKIKEQEQKLKHGEQDTQVLQRKAIKRMNHLTIAELRVYSALETKMNTQSQLAVIKADLTVSEKTLDTLSNDLIKMSHDTSNQSNEDQIEDIDFIDDTEQVIQPDKKPPVKRRRTR